jgi:hypothetical protein
MANPNSYKFCFNPDCCNYELFKNGISTNINYNYLTNVFFCDWMCHRKFSDNFCRKYNRKAEFDLSFYEKPEPI